MILRIEQVKNLQELIQNTIAQRPGFYFKFLTNQSIECKYEYANVDTEEKCINYVKLSH